MTARARARRCLLVAVVAGALGILGATRAAAETETVWIPQPAETASEVKLEGTLYKPAGPGPHPVLVLHHGSTGAGRISPKTTVRYPEIARVFVERGMAVLVTMRRGRGASGGDYLEGYECTAAVAAGGVERGSADLDAVMAFVAQQPWADPARLVVGGVSRGAFLSLVHTAARRPPARGVISFAGGWVLEHCDARLGFHERTLAQAGKTTSVPTLWLYAENDRNFGPTAVRAYHRAFTGAGGRADLHLFPPIGNDGHTLLPRRSEVWSAAVADFLDRIGLPRP